MRAMVFAKRNTLEIIRDPLSLFFGLGFPVILLILLSIIKKNIPVDLFSVSNLTPGIAVFGLSFLSLFSAQLIAKDRTTALLSRLFTTPMTAMDFILGYTLPLLPMALLQSVVCFLCAIILGLKMTWSIVPTILLLFVVSLIFIGLGLLIGSTLSEKAATAISGALLTNLCGWLSGTWFDLELVGGAFRDIAYALPFVHAVEMGKAALAGNYQDIWPHLGVVAGYGIVLLAIAVTLFHKKMKTI